MPKPIVGDNGSGMHVHQSVWKGGKNLFAGDGYAGLSEFALYYIGGVIKHAKALNAITNPGTNSYKRLVPGFEAPINLAYSARNRSAAMPHPVRAATRRGAASKCASRIRRPIRISRFSAMLMAGLDGVQNKIHPGDPMDKNLYDLRARGSGQGPAPVRVARRGARQSGQGPRVPHPRRRVHRRHDRRLHRAQDGGSHAVPDDDASGRVRHVLQPVSADVAPGRAGVAGRCAARARASAPRFATLRALWSTRPPRFAAVHPVRRAPLCVVRIAAPALASAAPVADICKYIDADGNMPSTPTSHREGLEDASPAVSGARRREPTPSAQAATPTPAGFPRSTRPRRRGATTCAARC